MFWELFPEEPKATLSVMAVSPRHHVLCCVRYSIDSPCIEDLQDAATHMKCLVPRLTQGKPGGKPGLVIFCTSACPF